MAWGVRKHGRELFHHIYAWGNDRHPVFKSSHHFERYLQLLEIHARSLSVEIIAYALMQWHVHLFLFDEKDSISRFMFLLHGDYAKYFNHQSRRVGHVFGERFQNKIVVTNTYGLWLSRYIHRQPVEANLSEFPEHYQWSSYRVYLGLEKSFIKPDIILNQFEVNGGFYKDYRQFVTASKGDEGKGWKDNIPGMGDAWCGVNAVCDELHSEPDRLLTPLNIEDRIVRRKAVVLLYRKYDYSHSEIAKMLRMTRMAVYGILKRK